MKDFKFNAACPECERKETVSISANDDLDSILAGGTLVVCWGCETEFWVKYETLVRAKSYSLDGKEGKKEEFLYYFSRFSEEL